MKKILSPWCKSVKKQMIDKDMEVQDLAKGVGMDRSYVSSIINGRVYSEPGVKKISDYLGIPDSSTTTATSA